MPFIKYNFIIGIDTINNRLLCFVVLRIFYINECVNIENNELCCVLGLLIVSIFIDLIKQLLLAKE